MVENNATIRGQPGVSFEAVGSESQCKRERFDRVLGCVSTRSAMSKCNRNIDEARQSLLHQPRLSHGSYDDRVFNLSGSEIVFLLLAGLVVLGPERLPGVIRRVGQVYGDIKRAAQGVEKELKDTFAEPLQEIQSTIRDVSQTARETGGFFGVVDPEPSPPMRPERASLPTNNDAQSHDSPTGHENPSDGQPGVTDDSDHERSGEGGTAS